MLKFFSTIVGFLFFAQSVCSQITLNKNSVVKNEEGNVLSYEEWQSLIKSHEYGLRVEKGDSPSFILYRLTEIQKFKADSARAAYASTGGKYIPSKFFTIGEKIYMLQTLTTKYVCGGSSQCQIKFAN